MFEQIKEAELVYPKMIDYLLSFYKSLEEHFKEVDSKTQIELMVNFFHHYKRIVHGNPPFTQSDFDDFCKRILMNPKDNFYFKKLIMFRCGSYFFTFRRFSDKTISIRFCEKKQQYKFESFYPYVTHHGQLLSVGFNRVFIDENKNIITHFEEGMYECNYSDLTTHTYDTLLLEELLEKHISK